MPYPFPTNKPKGDIFTLLKSKMNQNLLRCEEVAQLIEDFLGTWIPFVELLYVMTCSYNPSSREAEAGDWLALPSQLL